MTLKLPPVPALALRRIPAKPRANIKRFWNVLSETTARLSASLESGGTEYQQLLINLQRDLQTNGGHPLIVAGLSKSRAMQLIDGLNLHFVRQQHRDEAQFDGLLRQTGGIIAEAVAVLIHPAIPETCSSLPGEFGSAVARAELLRTTRAALQRGRLHIPLSEVSRYDADLDLLAQGRSTPQILDLLRSRTGSARDELSALSGRIPALHEDIAGLARLLVAYELEMLGRFEKNEYREPVDEIRGFAALRFVMKKGAGQ